MGQTEAENVAQSQDLGEQHHQQMERNQDPVAHIEMAESCNQFSRKVNQRVTIIM